MKILLVDSKAEAQTALAKMIENFDPTDRDSLDIVVSLANPETFKLRLAKTDVLIFGSGIEEDARELARQAKLAAPEVEIIMFVSDHSYSSGAFRAAQIARVRKVLPCSASPLDLLQELVSIHEQFRQSGKARNGRLIAVTHAKGGVGATTIVAGLGEVSAEAKRETLLWDLDIESKDLSRAMRAAGPQSKVISSWVTGHKELTRDSLREAVVHLKPYLLALVPPDDIAAAMDFSGHPEVIGLTHRIIELARVMQDNIIVDTAGRLGPASGTILRAADSIVVVIDDSLLGLSAVHSFLRSLMPIIKNKPDTLRLVCSGTKLPVKEIAQLVGEEFEIHPEAWSLPPIPFDIAAAEWAGSGKTLFTTGERATRDMFVEIARGLGLIDVQTQVTIEEPERLSKQSWFSRIFNQSAEIPRPVAQSIQGLMS